MDTERLLFGMALLTFIFFYLFIKYIDSFPAMPESVHLEEDDGIQFELDSRQAILDELQNRIEFYRGSRLLALLPVHLYEKEYKGERECVICLSNLEEKDEYRVWPRCSHLFHRHCIDQWLRVNNTCPLCRAELNLKYIEAIV